MLQKLKPFVPRPIKRLVRRGLDAMKSKYDWEFEWQRDEWLTLWNTPEVQAKCLEYWKRFRHLDEIRRIVNLDQRTKVLDVGCGFSSVLHYLPGERIGIDPLADRYRAVYNYPFEVMRSTGERLPFAAGSFDAVFSSNCIDHTDNPDEVLRQIGRVLKADGKCVLTCEVFAQDVGARNLGHPHSMTEQSLRQLVTRHFRIVAEWNEPWYGMLGYCVGDEPTKQREYVFVLARNDASDVGKGSAQMMQ